MGKAGFVVNTVASVFIVFFNILYCFPYALPTTTATMNYNSVILVGVFALAGVWWLVHASRNYKGPRLAELSQELSEWRLSKV